MSEADKIQIRTPDGTADAWVYRPSGAGPAPGAIFYPDAGGVRPSQREMAAHLASLGYVVLLPNIFYRVGEFAPFDMKTVFADPGERARIMGMIQQLDAESSMRDAGPYLDALAGLSGVTGKAGVVGYCLGGRIAFMTASAYAERVGAAACIHAGHLVTEGPDSPHLKADAIRARVYLGVADNDASCPPEAQAALAGKLGAAHVAYQLELLPGKGHGYAVRDLPAYDVDAAELHWKRVDALFATLRA